MKKAVIIKRLKDNTLELTSAELKALLPESYDYMRDLLVGFVEDEANQTTQKDLDDFDAGAYPVMLSFQGKIGYYAGHDIPNQPEWFEDEYDDIDVDVLEEMLYFVVCTKIDSVLKKENDIERYAVEIENEPLKDDNGNILANSTISVRIQWKDSTQSLLHLFPGYSDPLEVYISAGLSKKTAREIENIIA